MFVVFVGFVVVCCCCCCCLLLLAVCCLLCVLCRSLLLPLLLLMVAAVAVRGGNCIGDVARMLEVVVNLKLVCLLIFFHSFIIDDQW